MIGSGPIFDRVEAAVGHLPGYLEFRAGMLSRRDFAAFLDEQRAELVAAGVPCEDVDYAKRYPADGDTFLRDSLTKLRRRGAIASDAFDLRLLATARARGRNWDHRGRTTYIYPEEADLLAALADIQRPEHIVFLGAYYGYWAIAVLPALAAIGGQVTLIDPDPDCCQLAADNLSVEIAQGLVKIACMTGEAFLAQPGPQLDMVVIDAELPRDHPDPSLRGKGVYASLLAEVLPRLTKGALVVAHNILLADRTGAPVFTSILKRNRGELATFIGLARANFPNWTEIASTEGMGVGRLMTRA